MTAEAAYLAQVGTWLRQQRAAAKLTQGELAKAVGLSDAAISNWESGKAEMGVVAHARLRAFFKARGAGGRE
jgi:transcriptional regulator with XRE-family HTH domain